MTDKTDLYRLWNAHGDLLYVGISISALARLAQHKHDKDWFGEVANVTIESFPTRAAALSAESEAIKTECPAYNIAGASNNVPATPTSRDPRIEYEWDERVQPAGPHYYGKHVYEVTTADGRLVALWADDMKVVDGALIAQNTITNKRSDDPGEWSEPRTMSVMSAWGPGQWKSVQMFGIGNGTMPNVERVDAL